MQEGLFNVIREDGKTYQYDIKESKKTATGSIRSKEIICGYKVLEKLSGRERIDVRVYIGRSSNASTHYAIVWLHGEASYHGIGTAGGYGYDKRCGAISYALKDLGVAYDVCETAESGDIQRALEIMYKDIFGGECFIVEFHA